MRHFNINFGDANVPETDDERKERTGLSSLDITNDESKAVQKTPYRIDLAYIKARISGEEYINPDTAAHMTICIIELDNNYYLVGKSVPADPENFNEELGRKFAYEDAIRQAWPLFAFGLREELTGNSIKMGLEDYADRQSNPD